MKIENNYSASRPGPSFYIDTDFDPHAFFISEGLLMICPLNQRGVPQVDQSTRATDLHFRATREELGEIIKIIGASINNIKKKDLDLILLET